MWIVLITIVAYGVESRQSAGHHAACPGLPYAVAEVFHHFAAVEAVVDSLTNATVVQGTVGLFHAESKVFGVEKWGADHVDTVDIFLS